MNDVTLYIPCYNAAVFMDRVLPAVQAQTYPIEELIIVDDDASEDDISEAVKRAFPEGRYPVRIVSCGRNTGLAHARNVGVAETKTEYVASLDADCVPEPDWLETLMAGFDTDGVAGVCGRLVEKQTEGIADKWRAVHAGQHWGMKRILDPLFLFGHGNVFKTKVIRAIGGYDERLVRAGEDHDLSRKAAEAGYSLLYEPAAVCGHLRTDSITTLMRSLFNYGNWSAKKGFGNFAGRSIGHLRIGLKYILSDISSMNFSLLPLSILYPVWMVLSEFNQRLNGSLESG